MNGSTNTLLAAMIVLGIISAILLVSLIVIGILFATGYGSTLET